MQEIQVNTLTLANRGLARNTFAMMAEVFGEEHTELRDEYIDRLFKDGRFLALAAVLRKEVIGGITAYVLPMTRAETRELFIYDIAVARPYQRRGIGRQLVAALLELAADLGIQAVFVAADNDDDHALKFYRALNAEALSATLFLLTPFK
jgi:aminoglycoside 3-N-acetyltransferase I